MTSPALSELVSTLTASGVHLEINDDRLRVEAKPGILTPELVAALKCHKKPLLAMLRSEGLPGCNPFADIRQLDQCDRCRAKNYIDVPIHDGRSIRRDCANCHRFMGWPRWYDRPLSS